MPSNHLTLCRPVFLLPPIPPASESFPMSQLFAWGGQSTGVSALASFLPKNTQECKSKLQWDITSHQSECCCCCCVASIVSDSVRPHRRQPTRLPHPRDSPGKNTGVGCHFLLQGMNVKSESEVAQSCRTLATPWTAAYQAPPSMGFSRHKYWSGVPLPSPLVRIAILKKSTNNKCWRGCGEKGMLLHCYWEC